MAQTKTDMPAETMTLNGVAKSMGLATNTIWKRIQRGDLPASKIDGKYCIREDDFLEFKKKYVKGKSFRSAPKKRNRISLNPEDFDPEEALVAAIIFQAVVDYQEPAYRTEVENFFWSKWFETINLWAIRPLVLIEHMEEMLTENDLLMAE